MLKRWLPVTVIVVLFAGAYLSGLHEQLSLAGLIEQREALAGFVSDNQTTAIIAYMFFYITIVAVSFPGSAALSVTAGLLFGWALAGVATVISATIGATIIFLIAKNSFGNMLKNRVDGFIGKMAKGFQRDAFQYLLFLRLVPAFPFWAVNIAAGLLNMKSGPYVLATFFGIIPGSFAFSYLGTGLDSIIIQQERANPGCVQAGTCPLDAGALVTVELVVALVFLGILSLLPFVLKKMRGSKQGENL